MSPVPAGALSQSRNCHPEAAEPLAKASGSQRRISVLPFLAQILVGPGNAEKEATS
jgi:hypothetical protein